MRQLRDRVVLFSLLGFSLVSINFIEAKADTRSVTITVDATDISPSGISAEYTGSRVLGYSLNKSDFNVHLLYNAEGGTEEYGRSLNESEFEINPTKLTSSNNVIHICTEPSIGTTLQTDVDIEAVEPQSSPATESPTKNNSGGISGSSSENKGGGDNSPSDSGDTNINDVEINIPFSQQEMEETLHPAASKTGDAIWGMLLFYGVMFILSVISTCTSIKQLRGSGKN